MSSPDAAWTGRGLVAARPGSGRRAGSWRRLAEPRRDRRQAAARALLDVAAVQARLPLRADADGRRLRPGPGRGPARRAARGLVLAARQGPARAQCRPAALRGGRARRIRRRHLAAADRVYQDAAALPGQGDDRARVPRGPAAGQHLDDRAPGTARVSRPAVGAARADLHPRPHVHVGVLDRRLDPPAGGHRRAAGDGQPGADPAGVLRHPDRGGHVVAAGRGADRSGARRAGRPPGQAPVHAHDHRVAGQGAARARYRPDGWPTAAGPPGSSGTARSQRRERDHRPGMRAAGRSSASATSARSRSQRPARAHRRPRPSWS